MDSVIAHVLKSQELLENRDQWNGLWDRSQTTLPTSRAEFLQLWRDQFAPGQEMQSVVVEIRGQWVAALPIIRQRWVKVVNSGSVPRNDWLLAGNLLLDEHADTESATQAIATTLLKLPWSIYRFTHIPSHEPAWQLLRESLQAAGFQMECRPSYEVPFISFDSSWEEYQATWSKNHRKNMSRTIRRLKEQGRVELRRCIPTTIDEAVPLLDVMFQLEDSGWKGRAATSIRQTPGMPQFMRQLAEHLIPRRELEITLLDLNGHTLAFEFLWNSRGVSHSYKVGYDEKFDKFNPGQILMHELLRESYKSRVLRGYDCIGPVSTASGKWRGKNYQMQQWTIASPRGLSRALLFAYQRLRRQSARPLELCAAAATDDLENDQASKPSAAEHLIQAH